MIASDKFNVFELVTKDIGAAYLYIMDWSVAISGFKHYLMLEKSLSANSIQAYLSDLEKLALFSAQELKSKTPEKLKMQDIEKFLSWLHSFGLGERSQARILSGIKAFYKYLLIEDLIKDDPTDLIEGPKISRKIPDVLSTEELEAIMESIDLSQTHGHRDRAILETLYACGLRVSEASGLLVSNVFFDDGFVKIVGKGNKERLVPIGEHALHHIRIYKNSFRNQLPVVRGHEDYLFLNRFGKQLSRISIFKLVKESAMKAGVKKSISPHTFRHSFATHLIEGGANLRSIQEMLGHESITTTEIYTHLDLNFLRETILNFHPANQKKEEA